MIAQTPLPEHVSDLMGRWIFNPYFSGTCSFLNAQNRTLNRSDNYEKQVARPPSSRPCCWQSEANRGALPLNKKGVFKVISISSNNY